MGDVVYRDDMMAMLYVRRIFAQAEYNKDKLSAFLAGSISIPDIGDMTTLYYDKQHAESEAVNL